MKKRIARLCAIVLAGAMVFGLAACGSSDSSSGSDDASAATEESTDESSSGVSSYGATTATQEWSIGLVIKTATNAHFQDIAYGAQQAAQDFGAQIEILNTTTESDVEGQVSMCEDLIASGVDALILTPNDSKGVSGAVEEAHDAGVVFVGVDTEIENVWDDDYYDYVPSYIGVDHVAMAKSLAEDVAEELGGEGKVVIIRGVDAASSSIDRTAGLKEGLAEYDGIEIVAEQAGDYDTETAQTKVSNILQSNPDVDAILCCNDLMAIGAVNALTDLGYEVGGEEGVLVTGIDGNIVALQSIADGEMYATAYDWSYLQGYWAVFNAIEMLEGEQAAEFTYSPDTLITAENVNSYLPHGEELADWTIGDTIE